MAQRVAHGRQRDAGADKHRAVEVTQIMQANVRSVVDGLVDPPPGVTEAIGRYRTRSLDVLAPYVRVCRIRHAARERRLDVAPSHLAQRLRVLRLESRTRALTGVVLVGADDRGIDPHETVLEVNRTPPQPRELPAACTNRDR